MDDIFLLQKFDASNKVVALKKTLMVRVVIKLLYFDPIEEKNKPFPAGVAVKLMDDDDLIESASTDDKGVVTYAEQDLQGKEVCFEIDFKDKEYLDIASIKLAAKKDIQIPDNRRVFRLPEDWKSQDYEKFHDDRGGRFKDGVIKKFGKDELGTPDKPWEIVVNHKLSWIYLKYEYYNGHTKKVEGLPRGILVKAYDKETFTKDAFLGAATPLNDDGIVAICVFKKDYDKDDVYLLAGCGKDRFLRTDNKKVVRTTEAAFKNLGYPDFLKRYPLPEVWKSANQRTKFGADVKPYKEIVDKEPETSKGKPLTFCLDDFVLVGSNGLPVAWTSGTRFAIFDRLMAIRNPETNEPYLTKNAPAVDKNYFLGDKYGYVDGQGDEQCTRAVRVKSDFYDLTSKRTTKGDTSKGHVIGVRAAVLNDHPYEIGVHDPFTAGTGNFDLHYFHDCCGKGDERISHLLAHWCAYYRSDAVSAGDITNFKKLGTVNTGIRHEGKHPCDPARAGKEYIMRPHGPPAPNPKRCIRMRFYLSGRDTAPYHCNVRVYNPNPADRDSMGPNAADFSKNNYKESGAAVVDAADGRGYKWYTMAHEVGHAMGLPDEYLEPLADPATGAHVNADWADPVLPEFDQTWRALPYSVSTKVSLMLANKALRLRHFWQYANWLNRTNKVQTLLGNRKYGIEYKISGAKHLKYFLPNKYRNFFDPAVTQIGYQNSKTGTMDLLLYKVGVDETQYNIKNGACLYDSVLVVRLKMHYEFVANADGNSIVGWNSQRTQMRRFQDAVEKFNSRAVPSKMFTLESSTGDFKKCLVYFMPVYDGTPGAPPGDSHFELEVRLPAADATKNGMDIRKFTKSHINSLAAHAGKKLELTSAANQVAVFRYCLGCPPMKKVAGVKKWDTKLRKSDLTFLKVWMQTKCPGNNYTVKQY